MRNKKGFTLIEILVVVVLLSILGLILTNVLTQVLRGQNKINVVSLVKQNGQLVLDKLSGEIRSAEKVLCVGQTTTSPNNTIVLFRNGNYIRFKFIQPLPEGVPTANGYFQKNVFTPEDIPDGIINDEMLCTTNDLGQSSFLTDKDDKSGISIDYDGTNPIFNIQTPQAGFPDVILIKFRAEAGVKAGKTPESTVAEEGVLFTTAASVRGGK